MSTESAALVLEGISKSFPGVRALQDVSLTVRSGEVHALVGENGAGKSTLMAIAAGALPPDAGTITIAGTELAHPSPALARRLGLAVVYQHPALLPDLTVAENLLFAMPAERRPRQKDLMAWCRERLAVVRSKVDPHRRVDTLSVEERHLVEISKALALEPRVLILDEPTEPLLAEETEELFARVREITARGTAVIYISHRIPEVQRIADRLTVLRDGRLRGTYDVGQVSEDDILQLIVGRAVESVFPEKPPRAAGTTPVLELQGFSGGHAFHEVDLRVPPGEIVGLAGVTGNGQLEVLRAVAGLHPSTGRVLVDGVPVDVRSPRAAARAAISYVPGDRQGEALFPSLSVRENLSMLSLDDHATAGVVNRSGERRAAGAQVEALAVRTPHLDQPVAALSGGNQQKVVLGRSLLAEPRVLLADEPTQGVDVGARAEIYRILRRAADDGVAVVVLSSDAVELQGLCDRVLVFSRGAVVQSLQAEELSEESITQAAVTATTVRRRADRRQPGASPFRRFAGGDYAPGVIVLAALVALALVTTASNSLFLSDRNLSGMFMLMAALMFIGLGQAVVMMIGGIDLSVGPLAGFLVVVASFFINDGQTAGTIVLGVLAMIGCAIGIGLLNGVMVRGVRMSPVIATLVTFIVLQGLSLLLRPQPGGSINLSLVTAIGTTVGFVPVAFLGALGLGLALELALRRSRWGLELRSVGSREEIAHALGARVTRTHLAAYVACALLTFVGAIMLMAQVGIGDATAGSSYTLSSITAVVLGGASVFGGRGSFLGVLCGAALIQTVLNATTFLALDGAWQYWLLGGLTLAAVASYSVLRDPALRGRMSVM